ncbi:hypothetical protein A3A71_00475 [Candidatus Berkelbacteria bacterium RIFCSPLOWO2_01_FULL_50_28]|uniref:Uncharacterized protein n=1 Tax=Candidatus Berkelbacteria bacterium RIFCSPLOWO2_01_FULL_50_28 TaxID=1797471 RepID=A0A1F5EB52_9BACT|nr:MAG: hypothetical protein A2807_01225 [Candidatus Berkelbacteria bacterium RIFCSPHIGHO2_01_FULL_50_36]OGD62340.1 MAG: hypothetical protein A3F39_02675 [Candidatus Berkelbacteria bacterium RIFCSPHIGHO2_12_FULL_50_11]OGD64520.1 MAG: hypothetical protein A3A71_00475 [Candidatus Berkelbacteria bacterium RIFCSPLOWO2_01_FULL_50_28]
MLESLKSILHQPDSGPLKRIYQAQQIQTKILEKFGLKVRVVIRPKDIVINCESEQGAFKLSLLKPKIYAIVGLVVGGKTSPRKLRISVERGRG